MKVLTVIGTRPEAIKMAPVIKALENYPEKITSVVCATAQHREMLDQVLNIFNIKPDFDLNVMVPAQTLPQLTAKMLTCLDDIVTQERPDWILVQGDTTTVMAAALIAYYHRIRLGHVEAGLRTHDKWQPYPEEMNRRLTDVLADLYFAPTQRNRENLLREGVAPQSIVVTGNTVVDALLMTVDRLKKRKVCHPIYGDNNRKLILVTAHRRESFGKPIRSIFRALAKIATQYASGVQIIYPVHPNPNVLEPAAKLLKNIPNITLTEPLDYQDFVLLMSQAYLVLTDSGGLQEEAPSLGVPVLVLRELTERPEGVTAGTVKVVGTSTQRIVDETSILLDDLGIYNTMANAVNPYGDGNASERILSTLLGEPIEQFIWKPESNPRNKLS